MSRSARGQHGLHASGARSRSRSRSSLTHALFALGLLAVLHYSETLAQSHKAEGLPRDPPQYEVVHPTRVDAKGHFLSNFLSHHVNRVRRREAPEEPANSERIFYQLWHGGQSLHFNLTLNPHLLAPGFLTERRYGGLDGAKVLPPGSSQCHFLGEVWDEASVRGSAAISTCDGLTGLFKLSDEEFFIQPMERSSDETTGPQAHVIYKRHTSAPSWSPAPLPISGKQAVNGTCGVKDLQKSVRDFERQRERWEQRQQRRRRIRQRSVSREKWVETLVVADPKMVEYHGAKDVESYVLAVMNIVSGLFRDPTIGNAINIVVVRLILLEQEEEDLKITHHADSSLNSFCKWQKRLNMKGDEHPQHHDVAVLLTRKDICAAVNTPCETLGLSHVAGMCQPHRSCSISEDTGLPLAFTVAHEMGHNFGIQHDGNGNDCQPIGKRPFVMSPQLLYGTSMPRWSRCSRQYITRFLDRGWGWCLDDVPAKDKSSLNLVFPGVLYSAAHQCRLQYGSGSLLCGDDMDNICSTLWCTVGTTCHSKLDGAVDGTSCGEDKWCFSGECVAVGFRPESVSGGWAPWSQWSACSRTCGAGFQNAQRDCDNPVPKNRGKYCLGERQRYRICNTAPCPQDLPTFRDVQCSHFNTVPYKGKFYKWVAVNNKVNPCELHCRPLKEHFSEKMLDAVADGTRCYEGSKSQDMCINGICKSLGCDYVIDSNAELDRCGICNGNDSTCATVRRSFEDSEGLGYVDIGLIPEGAWGIRIEEVAAAGNFLALRSDVPNKYFLNGGWTIQWNGDYKAAGTVFTYERTGQLENLTSPGPTKEPLWIQLLFQETNPGVRYEYTISRNVSEDSDVPASHFFWKFGSWTECSVTCGKGVQRHIIHCVERTTGIVEEHLCEHLTRPDDKHASCNKEPCPAIWSVGEWQKCTSSCGNSGLAKRMVMCIQSVSVDEQKALQPSACKHTPRPVSISSCNTHIPCPADWIAGNWSKCSITCGSGVRLRNVTCSRNTGVDCDPQKKPVAVSTCSPQECPQVLDNFGGSDLSGSGWSSKEVLNEINSIPEVNPVPKHTTRAQPWTHNDLNNIVEADFSYHNNLDNIDGSFENTVQVDDFYYDYNFINFHEDLSNDFDSGSNGIEGGDDHTLDPQQEAKTTAPPVANSFSTLPKAISEDPQDTNLGNIEHNGTKESTTKSSDDQDVLLSEDYLLPVSTTPSPTFPATRFSQKLKAKHSNLTTKEPTQDVEHEGQSAATTDGSRTSGVVPTAVSAEEMEDLDLGNIDNEEVTLAPDMSGSQGNVESPEPPLGSPSPDTELPASHPIQVDEIPQTTSVLLDMSPSATVLEDTDFDGTSFDMDTNANKQGNVSETDQDLKMTEPPVSEKSTSVPIPFATSSGKLETSEDTSWITGTDFLPTTQLDRGTQPSPTSTTEQVPTEPTLIERTGTDATIQVPSHVTTDFAYDVMSVPLTARPSGSRSPDQLSTPTSASAPHSTRTTPHTPSPRLATSSSPTGQAVPWKVTEPTSAQTSASSQITTSAYWVTGNWSTCSTSCGLGAIWRAMGCSTGSDSDCDPAKRPVPAQRCYLRPCSIWRTGEWSKCSNNCDGGAQIRDVQCFDMRDQRALRPFHCRAMSSRPRTHMPCNPQPCLDWYTSSWGQCSEVCGGGEQQRIVTCPEENGCGRDLLPQSIQTCNNQPCAQWLTGAWGQCSASCGGGVKRRLVKCVDTKAETEEEEVERAQCDAETQPEEVQKCNLQECESAPSGAVCLRDRLTSRFCQTLRWLGRCQLTTVQAQCCRTCSQRSHANSGPRH
ncbi:A disintegrin and metalloproteinase with thrombospondin motifs 7 [Genypterus blacodes]|uniref:A disintegrin and metalloproteinase with thrombospondin motifs 7 n=1 Tax=Genypterus blacodes TaxID=154954 RepID=UPI003F76D9A7